MIDGHGDDLFRFGDKVRINFSTNIPQSINHDALLQHLQQCGAIFSNYPEPEPRSVEARLAELSGVCRENVIVTNGATEAIYLLAHLFEGKKSAIIVPTFREYQDAARVFNHKVSFIHSMDVIAENGADMVWLCNPNNPTGQVYERESLLASIDRNPEKLFIVDQAYALYSVRDVLTESDVTDRENVVVLSSLTKQFMIPGLRIGYAIGPKRLIDKLRGLRMPWSVNSVAIEAARFLLANAGQYSIDRMVLHQEAERIRKALEMCGISTLPTDCNFLLARLPIGTAAEFKEWLVVNHGILIRDASNFESLAPQHFRIAAQTREENNEFIESIKEWISL